MPKHIKLMADYNGKMLWRLDPPDIGPIDPERLPLESETIRRLHVWAEEYNESLNWDDPANTEPWSADQLQEFEAEGIRLWLRVRGELGSEYLVSYFSETARNEYTDPNEILDRK